MSVESDDGAVRGQVPYRRRAKLWGTGYRGQVAAGNCELRPKGPAVRSLVPFKRAFPRTGGRIDCAPRGRSVAPAGSKSRATDPMGRILRALTRNRAWTAPDAADPRLRGRAYAVPFAEVWEAALETARRRPRWTVTEADARRGEIFAEARTVLWRFVDDVQVRVSLDGDGLTRVDMVSASRVGGADLGVNARRIARFLHALDRRLRRRDRGRDQGSQ